MFIRDQVCIAYLERHGVAEPLAEKELVTDGYHSHPVQEKLTPLIFLKAEVLTLQAGLLAASREAK